MLSQQMKVAYMNQQGTLFVLNDERERGERERVICFAVATFFITLLYMQYNVIIFQMNQTHLQRNIFFVHRAKPVGGSSGEVHQQ